MAESMDTDELNLLNFSDQILPKIFVHLNDTDLFTATKVCKRFKAIARDAFALKYNGQSLNKYYVVIVNSDDATQEPRPYWPFFNTFGDKMTALNLNLHIDFMHCSKMVRNHWLFRTIEQKCSALKKLNVTLNGEEAPISLTGMIPIFSKLTHLTLHKMKMKNSKWTLNEYPMLICFQAIRVKGFQQPDVHEFIAKNPQLQQISLVRCEKIGLNVLDKMHDTAKQLKLLELITLDGAFSSELDAIKMEKLESLKISVGHSTIIGILQKLARGCENLRYLEVMPVKMDYKCEIRGDVIDVICSFKQLIRLDIFGRNLQMKLLLILLRRLPNLFSLRIRDDEKVSLTQENILELFGQGKNLVSFMVQIVHAYRVNRNLSFDLDFFERFNRIVKDRSYAKIVWDQFEKTIVTKEKIIKNGRLVHWIGYEADRSLSRTHILDLPDKCFQKIITLLDGESHRALYETCKRTRHEVQGCISRQLFQIDLDKLPLAQDTVRRFGDDISRLVVNTPATKSKAVKHFWNSLMEKCGKKLVELHVRKSQADVMKGRTEIDFMEKNNHFANLTMLVLEDIHSVDFSIFTVFNCPKLTHLELYEYDIECPFIPNEDLSQANIFNDLISIKLDRVDECMENVIKIMDEATCGQVKEFTVGGYEDRNKSDDLMHMMLINVISKFRNLTTLNLIVAYMENMNTIKYLFEHCTKLVKLSLAFESDFDFNNAKRMFNYIKHNCKQIEAIQLIQRGFTTDSDGNELDNTEEFDENFLKMVYDLFPRATLRIVHINYHGDCIKEKRVTNTWAKVVKRSL